MDTVVWIVVGLLVLGGLYLVVSKLLAKPKAVADAEEPVEDDRTYAPDYLRKPARASQAIDPEPYGYEDEESREHRRLRAEGRKAKPADVSNDNPSYIRRGESYDSSSNLATGLGTGVLVGSTMTDEPRRVETPVVSDTENRYKPAENAPSVTVPDAVRPGLEPTVHEAPKSDGFAKPDSGFSAPADSGFSGSSTVDSTPASAPASSD